MTTYTNDQLKQALAKMLPEELYQPKGDTDICWSNAAEGCHEARRGYYVLDTELLHICWMIKEALNPEQQVTYLNTLYKVESVENNLKWRIHPDCHATWQQRTVALAKVKGIEI